MMAFVNILNMPSNLFLEENVCYFLPFVYKLNYGTETSFYFTNVIMAKRHLKLSQAITFAHFKCLK